MASGRRSQQRLRISGAVLGVALAVLGATLVLPGRPPVRAGPLLLVLAICAALLPTTAWERLSRAWDLFGGLVGAVLGALIVAFTGGTESPYHALFILIPVASALQLPLGMVVVNTLLAALGRAAPLLYDDGHHHIVAHVLTDGLLWLAVALVIHHQVRRDRHLRDEIARLSRLKSSFLQAANHALRTPVATLQAGIETLRESGADLDPSQRDGLLDSLMRHVRGLAQLVADLLSFEGATRPEARLERAHTDLGALTGEVVRALEAPDHPITLEAAPVTVAVDPARVRRAVEALVRNAVLHTPAGTDIEVRVRQADGWAVVTVDDAGPGVPDAVKDAVLAAHGDGRRAPGPPTQGLGMGLTLALRYAELHGGSVRLDDRPDGGTRARLALPVGARDGTAGGEARGAREPAGGARPGGNAA